MNAIARVRSFVSRFSLNPLATLPGAIFSIWHNISGSIFASIRRRGSVRELNR